jgi:hypothetical protein
LTADLLAPRGQQTIAVVHRLPGESIFDLFWDLMARVELVLTPKLLLFDGELAQVQILAALQEKGYPYVARKSITRRLRPLALAYALTDDWERHQRVHPIKLLDHTKTVETTVHVGFHRVRGKMKVLVISPLLGIEINTSYRPEPRPNTWRSGGYYLEWPACCGICGEHF